MQNNTRIGRIIKESQNTYRYIQPNTQHMAHSHSIGVVPSQVFCTWILNKHTKECVNLLTWNQGVKQQHVVSTDDDAFQDLFVLKMDKPQLCVYMLCMCSFIVGYCSCGDKQHIYTTMYVPVFWLGICSMS